MSKRRLLAWLLIFGLLVGLYRLPAKPRLVCRMTGMPMEAVAATPDTHGSCCAVAPVLAADGEIHFGLTSPGCCDLIQPLKRHLTPAVAASPSAELVADVWMPLPVLLPFPMATVSTEILVPSSEAAPRGPPLPRLPSRAPPVLS